jgi:hypothetical protein
MPCEMNLLGNALTMKRKGYETHAYTLVRPGACSLAPPIVLEWDWFTEAVEVQYGSGKLLSINPEEPFTFFARMTVGS